MSRSRPKRTIGITFNLKNKKRSSDRDEEYDEIETIEALRRQVERNGFKVVLLEQSGDFLKKISLNRPDFVLNLAEGKGAGRGRESQVPCVLESLGIPYSGSDPVALGITLDKYLTSVILKSAGVPVPDMVMASDAAHIAGLKGIFKKHPVWIVKPRWEGSSKGIFSSSVVSNFNELKARVRIVLAEYKQPALVEEFLEKEEITAAVCGNGRSARLLGMMKIVSKDKSQKRFLYSLENKRDWESKIAYEPQENIRANVRRKIEGLALKAFAALELRDISRIDFRLDSRGLPRIIDINPLPGLSPRYSDLPILFKLRGGSYPELIKIILNEAMMRCGF